MSNEAIKRAIKKLAGVPVILDRARVISVDKNEATCVVQLVADDTQIDGVKLQPITNDGDDKALGITLYPAAGSYVIIGQVDNDSTDLVVIRTTVIESIALDTATALKLLITSDGQISLNAVKMVFNDGNNGGIPLVEPLVNVIADLQKKFNDLVEAFRSHVHPGVQPGSGVTGGPAASGFEDVAPIVEVRDLQNKDILQ